MFHRVTGRMVRAALLTTSGLWAAWAGGCAPATPAQRLEQEVGVLRSTYRDGGLTEAEYRGAKQVALEHYARNMNRPHPAAPEEAACPAPAAPVAVVPLSAEPARPAAPALPTTQPTDPPTASAEPEVTEE